MLRLVQYRSPVVNARHPVLVDHRLHSGHGHNAIDVHHRVRPVDVPVARNILCVPHGVVVIGRIHVGADDGPSALTVGSASLSGQRQRNDGRGRQSGSRTECFQRSHI